MRHKIKFEKNLKAGTVTVIESSEVDPGVVVDLIEEAYSLEELSSASAASFRKFTEALRRRSFFPTTDCCEKLFEHSVDFFKDKNIEEISIEYDDIESFPQDEEFQLDDVELDTLLEEDGDSKEDEIKEIDSEDDTPRFTPEDTSEHEN